MMDQIEIIKLIIAWSLAGTFVFTIIATCGSMLGWVKFADPAQQKKLFRILVVELVIGCVAFFFNLINFSPDSLIKQVEKQTITDVSSFSKIYYPLVNAYIDQELEEFKLYFFNTYGPIYYQDWKNEFRRDKGRNYSEINDFPKLYSDLVNEYEEEKEPIENLRASLLNIASEDPEKLDSLLQQHRNKKLVLDKSDISLDKLAQNRVKEVVAIVKSGVEQKLNLKEVLLAINSLVGQIDDFIVLKKGEQEFMQTIGGPELFTLEYRDGSASEHYQRIVNKKELIEAFTSYVNDDSSWRTSVNWQKMNFNQ